MAREYIRKACLLGDGAVGKTSMVRRYVHDEFSDDYLRTVGTKVTKRVMEFDDVRMTMMLWDVLGQRANASLHSAYYKGANGALLVGDVTRPETIANLAMWRDEFLRVSPDASIVVAINKMDLANGRRLDIPSGFDHVVRTSAKTGAGVEEAFELLGARMVEDIL